MLYERTGGNLKRVTSISATAVIRVFGLHLNTWVRRREKSQGGKEKLTKKEMESEN